METQSEQVTNRDEQGRFVPGVSGNPDGRPVLTEEEKLKKQATEIVLKTYINDLSQALPTIKPALVEKAKSGDVAAIKEIHDRVFGKPAQNVKVDADVTTKVIKLDE